MKVEWEWDGNDGFAKVDYATLERNIAKNLSLASAYGMGPQGLDHTVTCEKCGYAFLGSLYGHDKRSCIYLQAMGRQADQGYVPVPPLFFKILKTAGIVFANDLLRTRGIPEANQGESGPYQRGFYAPVWAVLVLQQSKLGNLTSTKRPRVQAALLELQRLQGDLADQKMLAGEHILQRGSYTRACRALVAKASE